jgi:hypothetical protein
MLLEEKILESFVKSIVKTTGVITVLSVIGGILYMTTDVFKQKEIYKSSSTKLSANNEGTLPTSVNDGRGTLPTSVNDGRGTLPTSVNDGRGTLPTSVNDGRDSVKNDKNKYKNIEQELNDDISMSFLEDTNDYDETTKYKEVLDQIFYK